MNPENALRVMWLLNHTSARKFELSILKKIGIQKIFLPKNYPSDPGFRSANVDWSEDAGLDISAKELKILNDADWYRGASKEAWEIANNHFDVVFLVLHDPAVLINAANYFNGAVIWRAYGLDKSSSYTFQVDHFGIQHAFKKLGRRFYFGEAYSHLADEEADFIKNRRSYLPLGLANITQSEDWRGSENQIYFVCPDIGFNGYYKTIYEDFSKDFHGLNFVIAGAQPIHVDDPKVLGFVDDVRHKLNMTQSRVMYYHSQEPNHIHYHPFEAIRAGMPLIFMSGGILDRMGGIGLPGRCETKKEARAKIEKILAGDKALIDSIRSSQTILLEPMRMENCIESWRSEFKRIELGLSNWKKEQAGRPPRAKRKKIAIVLPIRYRGGSLRGAQALAQALYEGSRQWGEDADVVLLHLDDPTLYGEDDFCDLPNEIARRPFTWKLFSAQEARRAMRYAGFDGWEPTSDRYIIPDDGIHQLQDCDLWIIVSDRLSCPILPIKPIVLMVYDYLQRYVDVLPFGADRPFLDAARIAQRVLVTTDFTAEDALQYAGVSSRKVAKVPMLASNFPIVRQTMDEEDSQKPYFIWTTNAAPHKNHTNAAEALRIYYEELDGQLDCRVTGVDTKNITSLDRPHLKMIENLFKSSRKFRRHVEWMGELPDAVYRRILAQAKFLWHAGSIDNGTFAVVEAACFGVPALSSEYPAMHEIDRQFSLNLTWMDPGKPRNMAMQLKEMETNSIALREKLPSAEKLQEQRISTHGRAYWQEVRVCL